ncbi:MAG: hypothetical protein HQ446_06260 [Polaromonas sp.]|nr:hypothetical protein [Polaromonas sp.]
MKYMKNARTGAVAVFDADLVESGRWELVAAAATPPKPGMNDVTSMQDVVSVTLIKAKPEGKHEGKQHKA